MKRALFNITNQTAAFPRGKCTVFCTFNGALYTVQVAAVICTLCYVKKQCKMKSDRKPISTADWSFLPCLEDWLVADRFVGILGQGDHEGPWTECAKYLNERI